MAGPDSARSLNCTRKNSSSGLAVLKNCETACRDFSSLLPMLPLQSKITPTESGASSLENWVDLLLVLVLEYAEVLLVQPGDEAVERIGDGDRNQHQGAVDADIRLAAERLSLASGRLARGRCQPWYRAPGGGFRRPAQSRGSRNQKQGNALAQTARKDGSMRLAQSSRPLSISLSQRLLWYDRLCRRKILGVIPARYRLLPFSRQSSRPNRLQNHAAARLRARLAWPGT